MGPRTSHSHSLSATHSIEHLDQSQTQGRLSQVQLTLSATMPSRRCSLRSVLVEQSHTASQPSAGPGGQSPSITNAGNLSLERPKRSSRKVEQYTKFFDHKDWESTTTQTAESSCQETDAKAEEDARIERSMGVIRKNAASRSTDGGTKYHCDV